MFYYLVAVGFFVSPPVGQWTPPNMAMYISSPLSIKDNIILMS
jgi:hypothetical protein